MRHPERVSDYLENIAEADDRAIRYVADMDFAAFEQDTRTQDAVVRNIEIIGEALAVTPVALPQPRGAAEYISASHDGCDTTGA